MKEKIQDGFRLMFPLLSTGDIIDLFLTRSRTRPVTIPKSSSKKSKFKSQITRSKSQAEFPSLLNSLNFTSLTRKLSGCWFYMSYNVETVSVPNDDVFVPVGAAKKPKLLRMIPETSVSRVALLPRCSVRISDTE